MNPNCYNRFWLDPLCSWIPMLETLRVMEVHNTANFITADVNTLIKRNSSLYSAHALTFGQILVQLVENSLLHLLLRKIWLL